MSKEKAERNAEIVKALRGGATLREVAEAHGISRARAQVILSAAGGRTVRPTRRTIFDHDAIAALGRDGLSADEAAARIGCSGQLVRRVYRRHGIKRGPQGVTNPARDAEAARLYLEGRTLREVGAELGVGRSAVWGALKRAGVPRRSRGVRPGPQAPSPKGPLSGWRLISAEDGDQEWRHDDSGARADVTDRGEAAGDARWVVLDPDLGARATLGAALAAVLEAM